MRPNDVNVLNQDQALRVLYKDMKPNCKKFKIKPGDQVRISKFKGAFDPGYRKNWLDEIFVVKPQVSREYPVYKIEDLNSERIAGTFYEHELQWLLNLIIIR
ncbi:Uncharacterised protein g8187 [Pycnogonum litorale]